MTPGFAFQHMRSVIMAMPHTELVYEYQNGESVLQAVCKIPLFRFRDDLIIRIRPLRERVVIDTRSRSRLGSGDYGANARRIERLFRDFELLLAEKQQQMDKR
ncbi:DUF1499 domain-containing protein [Oligoflexia bacterium]|nr:DUF1499 domain-containing protein [Oligoflexia bacterium]